MSELEFSLDLPLTDHAAVLARRATREVLAAWGFADEDHIYDVQLVATELVSNAVRHGADLVHLELIANGDHLVVAVRDGSEVLPDRDAGPYDESGRGLLIIEALTERWGVEDVDGGKRVWAVVARRQH